MTNTKIPLSHIIKNNQISIKITSPEQAKKLVPNYEYHEDLEMFFHHHKMHSEYATANGTGFYFMSPAEKQVIDFENVEFDI